MLQYNDVSRLNKQREQSLPSKQRSGIIRGPMSEVAAKPLAFGSAFATDARTPRPCLTVGILDTLPLGPATQALGRYSRLPTLPPGRNGQDAQLLLRVDGGYPVRLRGPPHPLRRGGYRPCHSRGL